MVFGLAFSASGRGAATRDKQVKLHLEDIHAPCGHGVRDRDAFRCTSCDHWRHCDERMRNSTPLGLCLVPSDARTDERGRSSGESEWRPVWIAVWPSVALRTQHQSGAVDALSTEMPEMPEALGSSNEACASSAAAGARGWPRRRRELSGEGCPWEPTMADGGPRRRRGCIPRTASQIRKCEFHELIRALQAASALVLHQVCTSRPPFQFTPAEFLQFRTPLPLPSSSRERVSALSHLPSSSGPAASTPIGTRVDRAIVYPASRETMTRGRRKDLSIPPSRALLQQRDYRARKAQYVADLEDRVRRTDEENARLRKEIETLRMRAAAPPATLGPSPEVVRPRLSRYPCMCY